MWLSHIVDSEHTSVLKGWASKKHFWLLKPKSKFCKGRPTDDHFEIYFSIFSKKTSAIAKLLQRRNNPSGVFLTHHIHLGEKLFQVLKNGFYIFLASSQKSALRRPKAGLCKILILVLEAKNSFWKLNLWARMYVNTIDSMAKPNFGFTSLKRF